MIKIFRRYTYKTFILALLLVVLTVVPALSSNIYVPTDYSTIQAAVNAASSGDIIVVGDGTYIENVTVDISNLTIRSENGSSSTTVESPESDTVIFKVTADDVVITGFSILSPDSADPKQIEWMGVGVLLQSVSGCKISRNVFLNEGTFFASIKLESSSDNIVTKNNIPGGRYGVLITENSNDNTISENNLEAHDYGIYLEESDGNVVSQNEVGPNSTRGIYLTKAENNTIKRNKSINNKYSVILDSYQAESNSIYLNSFDNGYSGSVDNSWVTLKEIDYNYDGRTYSGYLGNYWGDYDGSDDDGNGVGETDYSPYSMGDNADSYPLIEEAENYEQITPSPDPQITNIEISTDNIQPGKPFTLTVDATNKGEDAYHDSTISVSFPSLYEEGDGSQVSITDKNGFSQSGYYTNIDEKGDIIYDDLQQKMPAKYVMVEGGTVSKYGSDSPIWTAGEDHHLEIEVTPEESGEFPIYIRETLTKSETDGAERITDPASSSYTDQQGYKVKKKTVSVGATKSLNLSIKGKGTVTITKNGVKKGSYNTDSVIKLKKGSTFTLKATPNTKWGFTGWEGDKNSSDKEIKLTMDSDHSLTANFDEVIDVALKKVLFRHRIVNQNDSENEKTYPANIVTIGVKVRNKGGSVDSVDSSTEATVEVTIPSGSIEQLRPDPDKKKPTIPEGEGEVFLFKWELDGDVENQDVTISLSRISHPLEDDQNNEKTRQVSVYFDDEEPFDLEEDAYSFKNPSTGTDFSLVSGVKQFGKRLGRDNKVKLWGSLHEVSGAFLGVLVGHCYGMAATSILYKEDGSKKPVDKTTYKMKWDNQAVKNKIRKFHGKQIMPPWKTLGKGWEEEYSEIKDNLAGEKGDEPVLVQLGFGSGRHAVVAHQIIEVGDKEHDKYVAVYDNRYPASGLLFEEADYWYLTEGPTIEARDYSQGTLETNDYDKDLEAIAARPSVPHGDLDKEDVGAAKNYLSQIVDKLSEIKITVRPAEFKVVVEDEDGNKIGYENGSKIDEIPGADMEEIAGFDTFSLPAGNHTYTVDVLGEKDSIAKISKLLPSNSPVRVGGYEVALSAGDRAVFQVGETNTDQKVKVDMNGDGTIDKKVEPSYLAETSSKEVEKGSSVGVDFPDFGLSLTFDSVKTNGYIDATTVSDLPFETNLSKRMLGAIYKLKTTATYEGGVEILLQYDDSNLTNSEEKKLKLYKASEEGGVKDITTRIDTSQNLLYGRTLSLSNSFVGYGLGAKISISSKELITHGPNPVPSEGCIFWLNLPGDTEEATLRIYDIDGKPLFEKNLGSDQTRYPTGTNLQRWKPKDANGHKLGSGFYLYRLKVEHTDGTVTWSDTHKLVVDRSQ